MSNEGIELKVLASTGAAAPTYVDTLTGRMKPQYLDEIGTGGGSFVVSPTDPQVVETPSLLDYRNVIQHCVDGNVIGAWLIRTDDSETIATSEGAAEVRNIAGPGLLEWLDDSTLKPSFGYTRFSGKKRFFNFATERGDWYVASQWTNPRVVGSWGDQPWFAAPDDFPEDARSKARWVWNGAYTGSGLNIQSPPWVQNTFRMEFTTGDDGGTWVFYMAGDDFIQAWVDGAEVVTTDYTKSSWGKVSKVEMTLPAGDHVFAARVTNGPVGPGAFMAALYHNIYGTEVLRKWTGQNTTDWKGNYNPAVVPTWSPGEIMVKILNEAKARGVRSASWLKPTFTSKLDSSGQPWAATSQDWEFEVGGSYLKVLNSILELGYYAWVNPATFELNLSATRGNDRSVDPGGVVFERGKNLRKAASSGVGKVKNSLDIATAEGWLIDSSTKNQSSISKYGVLEGTWSADVQASVAKSLIPRLFKQYSTPEEGASYDIVAIDEIPFVDYGVADLVLAPDKRDLLVQRRVVSISSEEDDNGQLLYTIEFDTIFKSNEQKLNQIVSNITGGTVGSGMSNSTGTAPSFGDPVKPIGGGGSPAAPKAPTNLAIDSTGSWNATGVTPTSTAILTWDPVVLDMFNNAIIPEYYEVWGKSKSAEGDSLLATVTSNTATITPFVPGTTWSFRVRALLTQDGPVSAYTAWQDELMIGPSTPLPAPSTPILETAQGLLTVKWDGLLSDGAAPAPQFRYVYAQVSTDGTVWVTAGSALQRDGRSMNIAGLQIGTGYQVRLIAVDGLGIASAPSGIASTIVKGIDLGPLEQTLDDAKADIEAAKNDIANLELDLDNIDVDVTNALNQANAATTIANGKNTIFQWTTAPTSSTPGKAVGDIGWVRSVATGIVTAQYEWNGTTWLPRTLDNATIANLNAGKLTAGFLDAGRIAANSLTAGKLILTDPTNFVDDSLFQFGATPWTTTNVPVFSVVSGVSQVLMPYNGSILQNHSLAVTPGDVIRVTMTYKTSGFTSLEVGSGGPRLVKTDGTSGATFSPAATVPESNSGFVTINYEATIADGVYSIRPQITMALASGRSVTITEFSARRKNAAELIVDGGILATMIGVDQVQTRHMQAGSIDATKIQVGSLVAELFAAGTITARELAVDAVEANNIKAGAVQTSHLSPSVGQDLDISANDTVTIIAGQVADAQGSADANADELATMQTYYEFGPDGARISTPASPFAVGISNDRIEMLENGNVVSYWNSGSLYVGQLVGEKVILGNHQLEKYNTGTVVRAL